MFAFNIAGLPALSVPTAWTEANAPVGVEFVVRYGEGDGRPGRGRTLWQSRRLGLCTA